MALGITGQAGAVAQDQPTHTIPVPVAITTPPADLADNVVVTVDVEPGKLTAFRVLRSGIDKGAGVWKLYVRTEDGYVPPVQPGAPSSDEGYEP